MWAKQKGFTIVELLIVIVVIAILAAISIVAYNGIQQRAKYTENIAKIEEIGKAIRMYRAEGGSMSNGIAGANGLWYGASSSVYGGTATSIRQALVDSGHLSTTALPTFMMAQCTTNSDERRVVLARVDPIPEKTVAQQIESHNCNNGTLAVYTDPALQYKMNIGKVF
jgi:prepilin-type N-terminal cleavage/methylation domain-containing protein